MTFTPFQLADLESGQRVTFLDCVEQSLATPSLIAQFDRLFNANLSQRGSPIELMIDCVSGRLDADFEQFVEFVRDVIWSRLPPEIREGNGDLAMDAIVRHMSQREP
jgi:hypothetical protein